MVMAISQACNNARTVKRPNQSVDKLIKSCLCGKKIENGCVSEQLFHHHFSTISSSSYLCNGATGALEPPNDAPPANAFKGLNNRVAKNKAPTRSLFFLFFCD